MGMNFQGYVGSFTIWYNPNWDATFSTKIPSKVLVPWLYQCVSFVLKSPITTSKSELFSDNFSKVNSKFCEINKKQSWVDLEIYKEQQNGKVYHLFLTPNLCINVKDLYRKLLKEEMFCNKHRHLHAWF